MKNLSTEKSSIVFDEIIGKMRKAYLSIRFLYQNKKNGLWEEAGVKVIRGDPLNKLKEAKAGKDLETNAMGHF
jgi:hypothetical protein